MFGLELRKIGNTDNLFRDVDLVLSRNKVTDSVSDMVKAQSVAHNLHKMMQPNSFLSVCYIKNCAEMCGICIPKERMQVYSSAHCMHWNEMTTDYRQLLCAMILDDFRAVLTYQNTQP